MFHLAELSARPVEGGEQVAGGDRGQVDRVHGHHGRVWSFANLLDYQLVCCISFSLVLEIYYGQHDSVHGLTVCFSHLNSTNFWTIKGLLLFSDVLASL